MKSRNVFGALGVAMAASAMANGATLYRTTANSPFRGNPFARRQVQVKAGGLYYLTQVLANSVTTLVLP